VMHGKVVCKEVAHALNLAFTSPVALLA